MTLAELKEAYPSLYTEIEASALEKGRAEGFAKGKTEGALSGAEAERARIQGVERATLPGHEALINSLKFDGKTTPEQAAVKVLAAEREVRTTAAAAITADAIKPVLSADASAVKPNEKAPEAGKDLDTPEAVKADAKEKWEKDAATRAEFGGVFESYEAFRIAEAAGTVRIYKDKGGN